MAILEQKIIRLKELTIDWGYSKRNIEPSINEKKKVLLNEQQDLFYWENSRNLHGLL